MYVLHTVGNVGKYRSNSKKLNKHSIISNQSSSPSWTDHFIYQLHTFRHNHHQFTRRGALLFFGGQGQVKCTWIPYRVDPLDPLIPSHFPASQNLQHQSQTIIIIIIITLVCRRMYVLGGWGKTGAGCTASAIRQHHHPDPILPTTFSCDHHHYYIIHR